MGRTHHKHSVPKRIAFCVGIVFTVIGLPGCESARHAVVAATGTNIGVEISQNPANQSPQAKLGYQRTEFAIVPTNRSSDGKEPATGKGAGELADVLMELKYAGIFDLGTASGVYQRLAIGPNAVKQAGAAFMFARDGSGALTSEAAATVKSVVTTFEADENSDCLQAWLAVDRPNHKKLLRDWIKEQKLSGGITELIFSKEFENERAAAVKKLNIQCK